MKSKKASPLKVPFFLCSLLCLALIFVLPAQALAYDTFRVTEYYVSSGTFTGTTYELTLNQNLESNHFILVRGGADGNTTRGADDNYARVGQLPSGMNGELTASSGPNKIRLIRYAPDGNWVGVVTVVECLGDETTSGFKRLDVVQMTTSTTSTTGTDTSGTAWSDMNKVVLFGGAFGAGSNVQVADASAYYHPSAWLRLYPSSTNTINWQRYDAQSLGLQIAVHTVYVIEWGSEWTVQRAYVSGSAGGDGANATGEYNTTGITSVARANTWVWGTGYSTYASIGQGAEANLVTLGNGVNQYTTENTVAVGSEYTRARYFDVYTMTHSGLAVDYRFKVDGDSALNVVNVTVDTATDAYRMGWVTNGLTGTGAAFPRPIFSARYTTDTNVQLERGYNGQNFPAWVQGIDLSGITYSPTPGTPSNPSPADDATGVSVDADLAWDDSPNATAYDVYFDTVDPPVAKVASDITSSDYTLSPLSLDTQYFWKIVAKNAFGDAEGPVWDFTTCPPAPAAPSNPSPPDDSTGTSVDADLNWDDSADATAYDVYFDTVDPPVAKVASDIAVSSLTLDRLICDTHYYWKVVAKNDCNNTDGPVWDFITENVPDPDVPANPTPLNGATGVLQDSDLNWDDSANAESYDVYFGTDSDPPIYATDVATSDYALPTHNSNTLYYWKIVAKNRCQPTTGPIWNFTTCTSPGTPSNPSPSDDATGISVDEDLDWDDSPNATAYDVYFDTVNPPVTKVASDITSSNYTLPTLLFDTQYFWKVVSKNACGNAEGPVWDFTTCPPDPGAASNPNPDHLATDVPISANLSWDPGDDVDTYEVYFGTTLSPPKVDETASTTYDPTLDYSTHYYWKTVSKNECGNTTSAFWEFTTESCPVPGAASNPSPAHLTTGVPTGTNLSWDPGDDADSYEVYFGTTSSPPQVDEVTSTTYDPTLDYETHYYWKIVAKNDCGNNTPGPLWEFTTGACPAPGAPSNPSPAHLATGISIGANLLWDDSADTDSYEVYFGTDSDPPYVADTTYNFYTPTLNYGTHYYWKIVAKNDCGNNTAGPVWEFTTVSGPTGDHFASASGSNESPYTSWLTAAHNIQDAIGAASAGETVLVDDGTFTESVTIKEKNNLTLQSRNGRHSTSIVGQVVFEATVADLTGCVLDGFDIQVVSSTGIVYLHAEDPYQITNTTVRNCSLHDNSYTTWPIHNACGVVMKGKVAPTISGNLIYNNKGFRGIGSYYDGSYFQHFGTDPSSPVVIKGNTVHDNRGSGIEVNGYQHPTWNFPPGISVTIGGPDRADANHIYNHLDILVAGIELGFIDTAVIQNNEIHNNGNMYGAGIRVDKTVDTTIKGNDIYENAMAGIRLVPDGGLPMPDPDGPGGPIPPGNNKITIGGPLDADGNDIFENGLAGIAMYVTGSIVDPIPVMGSSIQKNYIHHNGRAGITIGRDENGGNAARFSETLIITQNDIAYNGRGGIAMHTGCELEITKNNIHHSMARGGIHTGDDWGHFSGAMGSAVLTIRQNKVHHNFLGGIDVRHASADVINNLVYRNSRVGARVGPNAGEVTSNTLANNGSNERGGGIIYDDPDTCDPACEDASGNCAADCQPFGFPQDPFPIENNISAYNERVGIMACFYSADIYRDYNLVYSNNQSYLSGWCGSCASPDCSTGDRRGKRMCIGAQLGRGCTDDSLYCCSAPMATSPLPGETLIFADPLFEDMANDDYQLQAGSPAIGTGVEGNDIGAYGGDYPIVDSEIPDFSY